MSTVLRVGVLMSCHNRVQTTMECLDSLYRAADANTVISVFLVDDGSSDNTGAIVAQKYPSIRPIVGDGSLYWGGGMRAAHQAAKGSGTVDVYLLLNDDVRINLHEWGPFWSEFRRLNLAQESILVGAMVDSAGRFSYGGFDQAASLRALPYKQRQRMAADTQRVDTFNGNFVAVPAGVMDRLDGISACFVHEFGDLDLGLRARRLGVRSYVASGAMGVCDKGVNLSTKVGKLRRVERLHVLITGPRGMRPYACFVWRHRPKVLFPAYLTIGFGKRLWQVVKAGEYVGSPGCASL